MARSCCLPQHLASGGDSVNGSLGPLMERPGVMVAWGCGAFGDGRHHIPVLCWVDPVCVSGLSSPSKSCFSPFLSRWGLDPVPCPCVLLPVRPLLRTTRKLHLDLAPLLVYIPQFQGWAFPYILRPAGVCWRLYIWRTFLYRISSPGPVCFPPFPSRHARSLNGLVCLCADS